MSDMRARQVKIVIGENDKAQMPKPALLDPLTGQVYKISTFETLPLTDYPLIIAEEDLLTS